MQIYVHRNNQQLGPFTAAEVKSQFANGALSVNDHVWWQGQTGWVTLGESSLMASGFQEIPGPTRPAPPPTPARLSILAVCALAANLACAVGSVAAIVMAHLALSAMKKEPTLKGRGLAIAGLIMGYAMTLIYLGLIECYILFSPPTPQSDEDGQQTSEFSAPSPQTNSLPPTPSPAPAATNPAPAIPAAANRPGPLTNGAPASTNSLNSSTNRSSTGTNAAPLNP